MTKLTNKGRPKDGYYYPIICPKHGKMRGLCIGNKLICPGSAEIESIEECKEEVELDKENMAEND